MTFEGAKGQGRSPVNPIRVTLEMGRCRMNQQSRRWPASSWGNGLPGCGDAEGGGYMRSCPSVAWGRRGGSGYGCGSALAFFWRSRQRRRVRAMADGACAAPHRLSGVTRWGHGGTVCRRHPRGRHPRRGGGFGYTPRPSAPGRPRGPAGSRHGAGPPSSSGCAVKTASRNVETPWDVQASHESMGISGAGHLAR